MLKSLLGKRGQNTAEYAIIIALVIGAVIAMQTYVGRAYKAKMARRTLVFANGAAEYEPYYQDTQVNTIASSQMREQEFGDLGAQKNWVQDSVTTRNVTQTLGGD